jgi:hypothetical protein
MATPGTAPLSILTYQHPIAPKDEKDLPRWERDHRRSMDNLVKRLNEVLQPGYVPPPKAKQL